MVVIEPSTSLWCSTIVLMANKDDRTRLCFDYRKFDFLTVAGVYKMSVIYDWFGCKDINGKL
jgi:hypothetical protein